MRGQVTRSGQVTPLYKNFTIVPQLQCLRESYMVIGTLEPQGICDMVIGYLELI